MGRPKAITEEIKKQIIAMYKLGHGSRKISDAVGVSKSSVHRFIQGEGIAATARPTEVAPSTEQGAGISRVIKKNSSLFKNIPHSHLIDDKMLEQMKASLGYPKISYIEYPSSHQKKCMCYVCTMTRKKNWIQLKVWADINVTRSEEND